MAPDAGVEVHWRSGQDGNLRRVVPVESAAEAVRAYVRAGIVTEADAMQEQCKLEQGLTSRMRAAPRPRAGMESG